MTAGPTDTCPAAGRGARIVLAQTGDAQALTDVITAAFFTLAPSVWLFPDPDERERLLPRLVRLRVDDALEHGTVYTTEDRRDAVVWFPRSYPYSPPNEEAKLVDALGARHADRALCYDAISQTFHPHAAHDYLWALAVHLDDRRAETGAALLDEHHRMLDARGRAAYVQAPDTDARSFHLDLGYRDLPQPRIVLPPPDGCVMYGMWRPPCSITTEPPNWPTVDEKVRVRVEVGDWGGSTGVVVAVRPEDPYRPIHVALSEEKDCEPDPRRFAVAELEPLPVDTAPGEAPAPESDPP